MQYTTVTTLQFANPEHTAVNCWVKFDKFPDPVPFTASADDTEPHGKEIFARAVAGEFGVIVEPATE